MGLSGFGTLLFGLEALVVGATAATLGPFVLAGLMLAGSFKILKWSMDHGC